MIQLTDAARSALARALEIEQGGNGEEHPARPRARWARIVVDDYS